MENRPTTGCKQFQEAVEESLIRHTSILDILSKFHDTSARVHRATVKAITDCGCLSVQAVKENIPSDCTLSEYKTFANSHLQGELCENCQEVLETELGHNLFYLAALCNSLGIDLQEVFEKEEARMHTLGRFQFR